MAEDFGVEDRGSFYDRVGALRDVVQNHLLQVLALVTMDPPAGDDDAVSRHRLDVFRAMPSVDPTHAVRGNEFSLFLVLTDWIPCISGAQ